MRGQSVHLKWEKLIAADERGGILHRWHHGRDLLKTKAGRQQLPDGFIKGLVADASKAGLKISEREIQRRIKFATVYETDQQVRQILADLGSWSAIAEAGFPPVPGADDLDLLDLANDQAADPDAWEQLSLLPGLKPVLKISGREVPLASATVAQVVTYRDKYRQMHDGFTKTLDLIEVTVDAILAGCDGDMSANAVEAYQRAAPLAEAA